MSRLKHHIEVLFIQEHGTSTVCVLTALAVRRFFRITGQVHWILIIAVRTWKHFALANAQTKRHLADILHHKGICLLSRLRNLRRLPWIKLVVYLCLWQPFKVVIQHQAFGVNVSRALLFQVQFDLCSTPGTLFLLFLLFLSAPPQTVNEQQNCAKCQTNPHRRWREKRCGIMRMQPVHFIL